MQSPYFTPNRTARSRGAMHCFGALVVAALLWPVAAQHGHATEAQKPKAIVDKSPETDASRYCANVTPSIVEARIVWQTKRLSELDAQVKQRIADLEKAEASARDWVAKRESLLKSANDNLVAIYAKMQPESAARQISALDDPTASAILAKLKPSVAGAILDEMESERASKLAATLSGVNAEEKKS